MEAVERAVAGEPCVDPVLGTSFGLQMMGHKIDTLDCLIAMHKPDLGPDEETEWVAGIDILTGETIYVPFEAVLLDRTRDARYWMSSDGLASGNNIEEAVFHGVLERIERDAHVLWQVGAETKRYAGCVDPRGFHDEALTGLIDKIEKSGLALRLFDITSDIAIPCFTAILGPGDSAPGGQRDRNGGGDIRLVEVTGGTGAHPFPVRAAIRAVTEAAQSRLTYISGARDDISPATFSRSLPPLMRRAFDAVPVSPASGPVRQRTPEHRNLSHLLQHVLDALRNKGISSVIAVRLSDDTLPFGVVKVVIPQLENPEGLRARRFGTRALARAIGF